MQNINWKIVGVLVVAIALMAGGYVAGGHLTSVMEKTPSYQRMIARTAAQNGNDKLAFELYAKLAKEGDPAAAYRLGDMYEYGVGTKIDAAEAIKWLTTSAKAGNVDASRQLGLLYLDGDVVVQDFAKARIWLAVAAGAGDATALRRLGDMNYHGLGGPADPVKAYADYAAAVVRNSGNGTAMRDKLEETLNADEQKEGQKLVQQILARIPNASVDTKVTAAAQPVDGSGQGAAAKGVAPTSKPSTQQADAMPEKQ